MTLENAIEIGIKNNLSLQTQLRNIGISNAELIQAGFYSNPRLETIFKKPTKDKSLHTNIEVDLSFVLSDLWQVPLRKKIAQYDLEAKTYEIINHILNLRQQIQSVYISCVYHQEYLQLVKEITATINNLKKRIEYRYQFGYATKLDIYFTQGKLGEWKTKVLQATCDLKKAYIDLRQTLGGNIVVTPLKLCQTLEAPLINSTLQDLTTFSLASHPLILLQEATINSAQKNISYERSKIFDNVNIGVSYEQDFEKKATGVGPLVSFDIPLFNANYGNIEKAKFVYKKAKKALENQKQMLTKQITTSYIHYSCHLEQIEHYKKSVMPSIRKALVFSKEYFDRMQMPLIVFLETQIELHMHKIQLLDLAYKAALAYAQLELAIGTKL